MVALHLPDKFQISAPVPMAWGDRVIAVSDYVAQHVSEHYGVPPGRLRVIHRGIDMSGFDPAAVECSRVDAVAEQGGYLPASSWCWCRAWWGARIKGCFCRRSTGWRSAIFRA